jgi:hypothetical protein
MFFDVVFWDDALPGGKGVGRIEAGDGHLWEFTGWEAGRGYARQRGWIVDDVVPMPTAPVAAKFGPVNGTLESMRSGDKALLMAKIPAQSVDLAALGLAVWDPAIAVQPVTTVNVPGLGFPTARSRCRRACPCGCPVRVNGSCAVAPKAPGRCSIPRSAGPRCR